MEFNPNFTYTTSRLQLLFQFCDCSEILSLSLWLKSEDLLRLNLWLGHDSAS
jgi:hypothetical protein